MQIYRKQNGKISMSNEFTEIHKIEQYVTFNNSSRRRGAVSKIRLKSLCKDGDKAANSRVN